MTLKQAFIEAFWRARFNLSIQERIGCVTPKRIMAWRYGTAYAWVATRKEDNRPAKLG